MRDLKLRYYQGMEIARSVRFDDTWQPQDAHAAGKVLHQLIQAGSMRDAEWKALAGSLAPRLELEWYTRHDSGLILPTRGLCSQIYQAIKSGKQRICAVAPTGAGKTETMIRLALDATSKGWSVFVVVNRQILVQNMVQRFASYGVRVGMIWAEAKPDPSLPIQVCSEQTLAAHKKRDVDQVLTTYAGKHRVLWLWDEAHEVAFSGTGREIFQDVGQSIHVLFTATPRRTSPREGMGDVADAVCMAPLFYQLEAIQDEAKTAEYLAHGHHFRSGSILPVDYRLIRVGRIDTSSLSLGANGDYQTKPLSARASDPRVLEAQFSVWLKLAERSRSLGFCVDTEHTLNAARFWASRVPSAVLLGDEKLTGFIEGDKIRQATRADLAKALADGTIKALFSCDAITTGFDCPPADCLIVLRPTQSWQLHVQIVGRGVRPCPQTGKTECLMLDFAGNTEMHLPLNWLRAHDFELRKGDKTAKSTRKGQLAKCCPRCLRPVPLSADSCPCGHVFNVAQAVTGQIVTKIESVGAFPPDQLERLHMRFRAYHRRCWTENIEKARHVLKAELKSPVPDSWMRGVLTPPVMTKAQVNQFVHRLIMLGKGRNHALAVKRGGLFAFVTCYWKLERGSELDLQTLTPDLVKELL